MTKQKSMIMGVINLTPDSFSDGGRYSTLEAAITHAFELKLAGADLIDLGAESSRPGAKSVSVDEEWRRLEPVLFELKRQNFSLPLSIDTYKPEVMQRAADLGVAFINNIMGLSDFTCLKSLARYSELNYIAMHMNGVPATMQASPLNGQEALVSVADFFESAREVLCEAGFRENKLWFDPGIGFGKTNAANWQLLQYCMERTRDLQLVIGVSRKSFIGAALGIAEPHNRDAPTKMLEVALMASGVSIIRTHEVRQLANLRGLLQEGP